MSSQLQLQQQNNNIGLKRWQFILTNTSKGSLTLDYIPDGWSKGEVEYQRSVTYHGISRTVSVNELTFFKEGRDYIQSVYELQGPSALILLTVNYLDESDFTYKLYHTGKVDLFTYNIDEIGVSVGLIDGEFSDLVFSRDSNEVDLNSLTTMDGTTVSAFPIDDLTMPDTSINNTVRWDDATGLNITATPHLLPLTLDTGTVPEFDEAQDQDYTDTVGVPANGFYYNSITDRVLNCAGTVDGDINTTGTGDFEVHLLRYNSGGVLQEDATLIAYSANTPSPDSFSEVFDYDITVNSGDSLLLQGYFNGNITGVQYSLIDVDLVEDYTGTPEKDVYSFPYYEAFLRCSQIITNDNNPFYSDYFGRTDTPLTTYASDGKLGGILRGIYFRLSAGSTRTYPTAITLQTLFKSLSSVFNLGMAVEVIGGVNKIRIEELAHFYNYTEIVDLSDRIRVEDIKKEVVPDMFYGEVSVGFNSYEYDSVDGLFEYNTKNIYSTPMPISTKADLVSQYRADNQGIRNQLLNQVDFNNEDQKGDDDIFLVDCIRSGGDFVARMDEGFAAVSGTVYAEQSFNLLLTPARSLRRHGRTIRAGLLHNTSEYLRWQASNKNTNLATRLTTESSSVVESSDVLISDLDLPIWYNEMYRVEAYLTPDEKQVIDANPHGLVKLDTEKYGWIKSLKTSNEDGKAEFEILRAKLEFVVDKDGKYVLDKDSKYVVTL